MAHANELRLIERGEVDAVAKLWHAGWRLGHLNIVPDELIKFRDQASFRDRIMSSMPDCYVLSDCDGLAGFVRFKGNEIDQFYVALDKVGQGIAAELMKSAETILRRRGVDTAFLIASVGNDRAMRFYEKHGWTNVGQQSAGVETSAGPFQMDIVKFEKRL
jgi:GNAT superfamily N-acetyltransferase